MGSKFFVFSNKVFIYSKVLQNTEFYRFLFLFYYVYIQKQPLLGWKYQFSQSFVSNPKLKYLHLNKLPKV